MLSMILQFKEMAFIEPFFSLNQQILTLDFQNNLNQPELFQKVSLNFLVSFEKQLGPKHISK